MTVENPLSLLWPTADDVPPKTRNDAYSMADLLLENIVRRLSIASRYERHIRAILHLPSTSPQVLAYRQAVIDDLLRVPGLAAGLEQALEKIVTLERYLNEPQWQESELRKVAWRLSELETYVDCVDHLNALLTGAGDRLQSEALCRLRDVIQTIACDELLLALKAELPDLLAQIRGIKSITIGVNLDGQLRPVEATLLSINTERFRGDSSSLLSRILGQAHIRDEQEGIGPLHRAKDDMGGGLFNARLPERENPLMHPLFRDLAEVMDQISRPIAQTLRRYTRISGRMLVALDAEIAFYLGAAQLIRHFQQRGLAMCRPQIMPMHDRVCELRDLYNINLALHLDDDHKAASLHDEIVMNDVEFGDAGRIFILTGPNRGGKTTYTQAIGLAQAMFQAGLYVPARAARMSPVDGIFTHFAAEERPDLETGRLGEEAQRLSAIFAQATRHSLILMNESLASTSAGESLYLARDIVRVIRSLGARAVFATHLHELAANCDSINTETPGDSTVISMVSMVKIEENGEGKVARRTYKVVPGPPMGMSYAREIAARYGISFEQLMETLRERQVIDPAPHEDQHRVSR
jgi:DNA mismatch repair protein MutS